MHSSVYHIEMLCIIFNSCALLHQSLAGIYMSSRILDTTLLLTKTAYSGYISASINNALVRRHVTFKTEFKTCLPVDQVFLSVKVLRCIRFLSSPFLLELIPVMNSCTFFQTKRPLLLSLINKTYENRKRRDCTEWGLRISLSNGGTVSGERCCC